MQWRLPFLTFGVTSLPEALGKRIVVYLELGDLLILICGDCNELCLLEDVRPEGGVGQLHNITGSDKVKTRLVLVHRVENSLQEKKGMVSVNISSCGCLLSLTSPCLSEMLLVSLSL